VERLIVRFLFFNLKEMNMKDSSNKNYGNAGKDGNVNEKIENFYKNTREFSAQTSDLNQLENEQQKLIEDVKCNGSLAQLYNLYSFIIHHRLDNYEYVEALNKAKEIISYRNPKEMILPESALVMNAIARCYLINNIDNDSYYYLELSKKYLSKFKLEEELMYNDIHWMKYFYNSGKFNEALELISDIESKFKRSNKQQFLFTILFMRTKIFIEQGDLKRAINSIEHYFSTNHFEESNIFHCKIISLLTTIYILKQDFSSSLKLIQKGLYVSHKYKWIGLHIDFQLMKAEVLLGSNNTFEALDLIKGSIDNYALTVNQIYHKLTIQSDCFTCINEPLIALQLLKDISNNNIISIIQEIQLQTRIIKFKRINPTIETSFQPIYIENIKGTFKLREGQLLCELALYNIYVKKDIHKGSICALQALQYIESAEILSLNTLLWCALIYVAHEMKDQTLAEIYSKKLVFTHHSVERDYIVHKITITAQQESEYYESIIRNLKDSIYLLEEKEKVKNEELNFLMMQLMKRDEYISLIQKKHTLISRANQKNLSTFCKETLIQYRNLPKIHLRTSLIRKHPILTSLETDICILLSIGLSSKEIAILMDKVPATIDNMRSIIQRKLSDKLYKKSLKEYLNELETHQISETGNELKISVLLIKEGISMSIRQMKVISLLCIHMGSKEICDIMGISVRTLENHKYRIKKKLGLDKNKDLIQFLMYKLEPECN